MHRILKSTGSIYLHCDPTASHYLKMLMDAIFGARNFRNEIVWHYTNASRGKKVLAKSHDILFWYSKTSKYVFNREDILVPFKSGMTQWRYTKGGQKGKPIPKGKTPDDVFVLPSLNAMAKERLGYPTQKPLGLLAWLVESACPKNGLVLDPFCGCGTTLHAAEDLERNWIGCDISAFAAGLVRNRLQENFTMLTRDDITLVGSPLNVRDALDLAKRDKFEFEKWACGEIGAQGMYHAPGTPGSDSGVDGIIPFYHSKALGKTPEQAYAIVQVKGGKVSPDNVKALSTTVRQHQQAGVEAKCGVFVCFDQYMNTVSNNMEKVTISDWAGDFPFIQPLSVEDMISGKRPILPGRLPQSGEGRLDLQA